VLLYALDLHHGTEVMFGNPVTAAFSILSLMLLLMLFIFSLLASLEMRARRYVFYRALRAGIVIDYANYDGFRGKLCNTPMIIAACTMFCTTMAIFSSRYPEITLLEVAFMIINCLQVLRMVDQFVYLMSVERGLMALPKFLENDVEVAKKLLAKVIVIDEYMALLQLRRIIRKQRIFSQRGTVPIPDSLRFEWSMLDTAKYLEAVPDEFEDDVDVM